MGYLKVLHFSMRVSECRFRMYRTRITCFDPILVQLSVV